MSVRGDQLLHGSNLLGPCPPEGGGVNKTEEKIVQLREKKINAFGKSIPVIAVVAMVLTAGIAGAAILEHYGIIEGTVDVDQSVLIDGGNYQQANVYGGGIVAGSTVRSAHTLYNQAEVPAMVWLNTDWQPDGVGITTTYFEPVDYSYSGTTGDQPVSITVEDSDTQVMWTVDFPVDDATGNGLMAVGLVIATDGEGNGPVFQIHNNDGTDANYDWGTWLCSPWGPTINDGWFGWHSGDTNTPVDRLDWVSATGGRYKEGKPDCPEPNPDGIFTITIDKSELGEDFHWALYTAIGSGFSSGASYQQATHPDAFTWGEPIVTSENYEHAILAEELPERLTLQPGETLNFIIVNHFNVALVPDIYTITTTVATTAVPTPTPSPSPPPN